MTLPLSLLELAPVPSGSSSGTALRNSVAMAKHAERLGFRRIWYAEHHNLPSIASTTTEVLIAAAAAATKTIMVGAGGVMLPNHAPLRIAETYKMLEALHPGRINLGIGRAPGTDSNTAMALRRSGSRYEEPDFLSALEELRGFGDGTLSPIHPFANVTAYPTDVRLPPIWLLGSGDFSAIAAANLGLGFAFAGHFSPAPSELGMLAYRENFRGPLQSEPSEESGSPRESGSSRERESLTPTGRFARPHAILALSVICGETDEHAHWLASSLMRTVANMRTSRSSPVPSPEEALAHDFTPAEREALAAFGRIHIIGTIETVKPRIEELAARTRADEVMLSTLMHSFEERLRSLHRVATAFGLRSELG